jgi:hypothetical protein
MGRKPPNFLNLIVKSIIIGALAAGIEFNQKD